MSSEAFVTLATNDGYGLGALVLAESIRQVGTKRNLVVLISNHLSDLIRKTLEISFDEVIVVDELNSNDIENLNLLSRPELGITFTKINCWLLEQYSKCVFLDADCVVLRSIDDLFEREEFSAAPDAGWPDCFNSGVFVFQPSKDTFHKLMLFASQQNASFDGGDQGLLNAFFSNWRTEDISRHLPFTYNVTANAFYSYLPAVTRFRNDIHIVHFAGALKPWQLTFNPENEQLSGNLGGQSDIQRDFLLSWWRVMHQHVWPNINQLNQQSNANNKNIDGEDQFGNSLIGSLNYGNLTDNKGIEVGSAAHRRAWEAGQIDYYGRDSFDNIQQQLERNIQQNSSEYQPSQTRQISPDKTTTTTTTSILKTSLKEVTPATQQTTIHSQDVSKQSTTTTTNGSQHLSKESTNTLKSSLKGTTPVPQQQSTVVSSKQPTTPVPQQQPTVVSAKQSTTPVPQQQPTVVSAKQSTTPVPQQQPTVVSSKQPTTPVPQQQPTVVSSKQSTTPVPQQQPTVVSSKQSTTPVPQQQPTVVSAKQPTTPVPQQQPTVVSSKQSTTPVPQQQPTVVPSKPPTTVISQHVTELPTTTNVLKQSTNPLKSSLKEPTHSSEESTTSVSQSILKESTSLLINPYKTSLTETTSYSQRENIQTSSGSIHSNENKTPPLSEHESSWTVKSTIVTAYTQGSGELTGPTVVSKVVSETSATSSSDSTINPSIKPITDPTKSSGLNLAAKTSSDHFTWLFKKIFVAITYTISLCYLLFLVAIRRSKNTNIIQGNGTSVRGVTPSTNNGNRVNK